MSKPIAEVYNQKGEKLREFECVGLPISMEDGYIDKTTGRCRGCDNEYNEEKVTCYLKGKKVEFKDMGTLPLPLCQFFPPSTEQLEGSI